MKFNNPTETTPMLRLLLLTALLIAPLKAQIYADFAVSSGGTSLGTFRVLLEHTKVPRTCANFIGLASGKRPWIDLTTGAVKTNKPFYNGLTFHRLIHTFIIQGGSPNGLGTDGPGYSILDEYEPTLNHSLQYVISMAKAGSPDTGGSQFFITLAAATILDNKHSVFGKVISGTSIIDGFKDSTNFPVDANDKPLTPIVMDSVIISGPSYAAFNIDDPALHLPFVSDTKIAITRDAAASTMTAVFDRKIQTEYFTLGSPDLATWSPLGSVLSMDAGNSFPLTVVSRTEPRYFLSTATVDYGRVPNAPPNLNSAGKTLRLNVGGGNLDIKPNGSGGGTWTQGAASGTISLTTWTDSAPATGAFSVSSSAAFLIPLGDFRTTLNNYPSSGGSTNLQTWLSFHTPTSGWTEELSGGNANRFPFQIF